MKHKGLALWLTLSVLICPFSFSAETKDEAAPQSVTENIPVNVDTAHTAKTLMDYVFIAPAPNDKSDETKTQAISASGYLLDKLPAPVD